MLGYMLKTYAFNRISFIRISFHFFPFLFYYFYYCFNTFMLVYMFLKYIKLRVTLSLVGTFFGSLRKKIDTIGSLGDIENEVLVRGGYVKICELFCWFWLKFSP
jgi:hypothetical protein